MARPAGPSSARPRPSLGRPAASPRKGAPRDGMKEPTKDRIRSGRGRQEKPPFFSPAMRAFVVARAREAMGFVLGLFGLLLMVLLGSYDPHDPSLNSVPANAGSAHNLFGTPGAYAADLLIQSLGWAAFVIALVPMFWGWRLGAQRKLGNPLFRTVLALWGVFLVSMALAGLTDASTDPLAPLPGGSVGQVLLRGVGNLFGAEPMVATAAAVGGGLVLFLAAGLTIGEWIASVRSLGRGTVNGLRMIRQGARNSVDVLRRHGRTAAQAASVAVDDALRGDDAPKRNRPRFDEAVQLTEQMFFDELSKLVSHLTDRLAGQEDGKPKVFRDSAVENLTEFFGRFRQLNIHSSAELDQLVERAQGVLAGVQPQDLRDSAARRQQVASQMAAVQASLDGLLMDRPRRSIIRPASARSADAARD